MSGTCQIQGSRLRLPALGRIQTQSRAFPLPSCRLAPSATTGGLADWLQASIAWRGLPDNFQRLAHRKSRCRLLFSCFTSSPPSTSSQLRSNSQTSAHRRLSAAVHSTQKNLKTRKTRPFIDSLVEGSLQIYTVRYHHHHRSHCARARTGSIAQLFPGLVTDSAHAVLYLSPDTRYPFNTLDKRTWALFFVPSRSGNSRISCCISCRIASDAT